MKHVYLLSGEWKRIHLIFEDTFAWHHQQQSQRKKRECVFCAIQKRERSTSALAFIQIFRNGNANEEVDWIHQQVPRAAFISLKYTGFALCHIFNLIQFKITSMHGLFYLSSNFQKLIFHFVLVDSINSILIMNPFSWTIF